MSTKIIHLELKAIDMPNYVRADECAITMALKRAGYSEWYDAGGEIIEGSLWAKHRVVASRISNESYKELSMKVNGMFSGRLPAEDFEYDLVLEIANEPI